MWLDAVRRDLHVVGALEDHEDVRRRDRPAHGHAPALSLWSVAVVRPFQPVAVSTTVTHSCPTRSGSVNVMGAALPLKSNRKLLSRTPAAVAFSPVSSCPLRKTPTALA